MTRSHFASGFAGGLAALAVFNLAPATPDVLIARELRIVDAQGVVRAELGTYATGPGAGVTSLSLKSDEGERRLFLEADDHGAAIGVYASDDDQVLAIDAHRGPVGPRMILYGDGGGPAVQLLSSKRGNGELLCTKLVEPENYAGHTVRFPED